VLGIGIIPSGRHIAIFSAENISRHSPASLRYINQMILSRLEMRPDGYLVHLVVSEGRHWRTFDQRFVGNGLDGNGFAFYQPIKMHDDALWIDATDLMKKGLVP
jgi:hypothetical protein